MLACSKAPPPAAIVEVPPGDDSGASQGSAFTFQSLGCGVAGTQSVIAVYGTKVGVASLARTTMTQACTITVLGTVMTSQVELWNVCYAESNANGGFTSSVVATQPYVGPTGVGLAFDPSGNPGIAFTGVGQTPATERCGANDLFLTTSSAGTFGTPVQISQGSQSDGLVAAQAGNCQENVCGLGDVTGWWPTLGFDSSGNATMAYRDVHYGFGDDDFAMSDVELATGSAANGGYKVLTVDVARGGGTYNRLAFTPAGFPAVLQDNATGGEPGIYLDLAQTNGDFAAQEADGGWAANRVSSGAVGEQLGFAINAQGLFSVAYYDAATSRLLYVESTDGVTWSSPVTVDRNGSTGFYPSLAFDANGSPAIAYYRCNATSGSVCDAADDGLYLARRVSGAWTPQAVHADPSTEDGLYPALAFVSGNPVIAFQINTTDAVAGTTTSSWSIAETQ